MRQTNDEGTPVKKLSIVGVLAVAGLALLVLAGAGPRRQGGAGATVPTEARSLMRARVTSVDATTGRIALAGDGTTLDAVFAPSVAAGVRLSDVVFVTPNAASLSVTGHTFWLDPGHLRPIPPELFTFYLEVEGFDGVGVRTFAPAERRLNEDLGDPKVRENVRLLNQTIFGDRDYAVVGFQPDA